MVRNLVTVQTIKELSPIDNADRIEVAKVLGWQVVVGKRQFSVGDKVAYFEVDSFLPGDNPLYAQFLSRGQKVLELDDKKAIVGHVLRTAKLRGVVSQGLIMGLNELGFTHEEIESIKIGSNITERSGVFKWDDPIPTGSGEIIGSFPKFVQKTDSERVQNLNDEFLGSLNKNDWFATEKIDGMSATFWKIDGVFHIASRNWELSTDSNSPIASIARKYNFAELFNDGDVIQGEVYGVGVNGNRLKRLNVDLLVFNATNIFKDISISLELKKFVANKAVPRYDFTLPNTVDEAIEQVNGLRSQINSQVNAEGVVWWNNSQDIFKELGNRPNFKAINNKYLLKHGL